MSEAVILDTHACYNELVESGMPEEKADAVIMVFVDIFEAYLAAKGSPAVLDTHTGIKKLMEVGFDEQASEAVVRVYAAGIRDKFTAKGNLKLE